jgi:hypothetical protein
LSSNGKREPSEAEVKVRYYLRYSMFLVLSLPKKWADGKRIIIGQLFKKLATCQVDLIAS